MKLYPILLVCGLELGAEPEWPRVEKHALEFLETYGRIPIINPPGNVPHGAELGAEPEWPRVEKHALEFLETYVRIPTIHPPGNVARAAELFRAEPPLPLRRGALNREKKA